MTASDRQQPLFEGWLCKRGPTKLFKWQRRWCTLRPESFEYFEEVEVPASSAANDFLGAVNALQRKQCGSLTVRHNSRAVPFTAAGAPGDSAKYVREKPFGFCFDSNPDDGPARRLYYFDAASAEMLEAWVHAVEGAVARMMVLRPEDVVVVRASFVSDSSSEVKLKKGQTGTVVRLDEDGDALIDFHAHSMQLWVTSSKFGHLRKQAEEAEKRVALELIPQDQVIMHWAIRVGTGPTSLCYEFEDGGVKIGRKTALDQGYEMQVLKLKGRTRKTHRVIKAWAHEFDKRHEYSIDGDTLGGRNCQDFSVELCDFLGIDKEQLPWKQASQVKVALGAGAIAADVAMGTGMAAAAADVAIGAGTVVAGVAMAPEVMGLAVGAAAVGFAYGLYTEATSDD